MKKLIAIVVSGIISMFISISVYAMPQYYFDRGMEKGIEYFDQGLYYEAKDEFQWFCDSNWGSMDASQKKYALDYLDGTKAKIVEIEALASILTSEEFDQGMKKGIEYFNEDMYYEACDEFQWFCDSNWAKMNDVQKQYALDYLDASKSKFSEYVTLYAVTDGLIKTNRVHKSKVDANIKVGWSTTKPEPYYKTNDTIIKEKALAYYKSCLIRPSSLELYSTEIYDVTDDWSRENGITIKVVMYDGSALNGFGGYTRSTDSVVVVFYGYNNSYITWLLE